MNADSKLSPLELRALGISSDLVRVLLDQHVTLDERRNEEAKTVSLSLEDWTTFLKKEVTDCSKVVYVDGTGQLDINTVWLPKGHCDIFILPVPKIPAPFDISIEQMKCDVDTGSDEWQWGFCPEWLSFARSVCPEWIGLPSNGTQTCQEPTEEEAARLCNEWSHNDGNNSCHRATVEAGIAYLWESACSNGGGNEGAASADARGWLRKGPSKDTDFSKRRQAKKTRSTNGLFSFAPKKFESSGFKRRMPTERSRLTSQRRR